MDRKDPERCNKYPHPTPNSRSPPKPRESMSSWFERQASSHQVQLAAVAILSGVAVAGTIYGAQAIRRKERIDELKASIPELNESHHADLVSPAKVTGLGANGLLINLVKLTDFGAPSNIPATTREDDRAAALARRAQHGDYDEGQYIHPKQSRASH